MALRVKLRGLENMTIQTLKHLLKKDFGFINTNSIFAALGVVVFFSLNLFKRRLTYWEDLSKGWWF